MKTRAPSSAGFVRRITGSVLLIILTACGGSGSTSSPATEDTPQLTAHPDRFTISEDAKDSLLDVLSNDYSGDSTNNNTTLIIDTFPSHGQVAVSLNSGFVYTPNPDFSGIDQFTYYFRVNGRDSNTTTAELEVISVNDPPVAANFHLLAMQGTAISIDVLLPTSSDIDSDLSLATVEIITQTSDGVVSVRGAGDAVIYTPPLEFYGVVSFTYTITDVENGTSQPATVTIDVHSTPVAVSDSFTIQENSTNNTLSITSNDQIPDGNGVIDTASITFTALPSHGTVTLTTNGYVLYSPNPKYSGPDEFSYVVSDTLGASSQESTVSIEVVPAAYIVEFQNLPEQIVTNLQKFLVAGRSPRGSIITLNQIPITNSSGIRFSTTTSLSVGSNILEVMIETSAGIRSTYRKVIEYDPSFSTGDQSLVYVDSEAASALGTIVISLETDAVLGLIESKHALGISPNGEKLYFSDRTVFSTATHQEVGPLVSPLNFSQDIYKKSFIVSPGGERLYSRNEVLDLTTNTLVADLPANISTGVNYGGPTIDSEGLRIFHSNHPTYVLRTTDYSNANTGIYSKRGTLKVYLTDLTLSPNDLWVCRSSYSWAKGNVDCWDSTTFAYIAGFNSIGDFAGELSFLNNTYAVVGSYGNPVNRDGRVSLLKFDYDKKSVSMVSQVWQMHSDNTATTNQGEILTSSGSRAGIDVYTMTGEESLRRKKSFMLNINYSADDIRSIEIKP